MIWLVSFDHIHYCQLTDKGLAKVNSLAHLVEFLFVHCQHVVDCAATMVLQ
jgi:hypothetical protein